MTIETNAVVGVTYSLSSVKGGKETFIEKTEATNPLVFLFGVGGLIEGFEANLNGKKIGDTFDFTVAAAQAYGEQTLENIGNIPIDAFKDEKGNLDFEMLKVGNILPMNDGQGHRMNGKIMEVTATEVRMDFNHPLAGQDLRFVGEVVSIRAAQPEEIAHGHVHGEGGHHH